MQFASSPIPVQAREIDETHRLSEAIAQELWRLYGGKGALNWVGVERHLARMVAQARSDIQDPRGVLVSVPSQAPTHRVARREAVALRDRAWSGAEARRPGRGRSAVG